MGVVVTVSGLSLVFLILSLPYIIVPYGARSWIGRQTTASISACFSSSCYGTHRESERRYHASQLGVRV